MRIHLLAMLGKARIPLQIDVGFGDAVIPPPTELTYPIMLDFPAPVLRAYQRETVVAEKFHAMVERGIANSRMKDYADLWFFTETFAFDGGLLLAAIEATFARQRTALPTGEPIGLTNSFGEHPAKLAQWRAFVRKNKLKTHDLALPEAVTRLYEFLMPLVNALQTNTGFNGQWQPKVGWKQ